MSEVTREELGELLDEAWNHAILKAWVNGKTAQDALEEVLSEVKGCMCPSCRQKFEDAMREQREAPIRKTIQEISERLNIIERHLESKKNYPPAEGDPHEYESI
jgi:hypothetical protein